QDVLNSQSNKPSGENNSSSIYTSSSTIKEYDSVADIYADNVNAVVGIVVEFETSSVWSTYTSTSSGSGVIISKDGYILTNNHVVASAYEVRVYLNDKERW